MKYQIKINTTESSFSCGEEQHLLEGMQSFQLGLPMLDDIPVGCRGGGCGICKIKIIKGDYITKKMSRKHINEEELATSIVLACRVFPRSDLFLEPIPTSEVK